MILVVKLSGKVLEDAGTRGELCRQIKVLGNQGHRLLLVHGAGKQLTSLCASLGIETIQYQGRRVTDTRTLEAAKMVFSAVNRDLVARMVAEGSTALGVAAFDAGLITARRRPPLRVQVAPGLFQEVDFGLVGEILSVNTEIIERLWQAGFTPVISSLCADREGQILNINADTLASELAAAVKADRLMHLSDVEGVYRDKNDSSTRIGEMTADEARAALGEGIFTEGMVAKIEAILQVIERGVGAVQILGGLSPDALLDALRGAAGTLITRGAPAS